ncbi:PKD-like domain-containing protein [Cytophaga hutchinsonii]|nr:PKD-like domain-containing protein [Cytophaga hutchinsonii]SFX85486.1 parallel beta-helix repeat (two copies) [Cytophaga hutchinsonii ATCC 33406]
MKRLILSLISIFAIVFASQAVTYTVTSNADNGTGSLRQALQDASNNVGGAGPHTIIFNAGMTITLNSSLSLSNANLNGLTINGFVDGTAGPDVVIRGSSACGQRGLDINGSLTNMKLYGLVFQSLEYGIYFSANASATVNGTVIKGCYFGTDITGTSIQNGICRSGITLIGASSVTIGGPNTNLANGAANAANNSERCLFGGTCNIGDNGRYGAIQLQKGSNNVSILNNYIGVNLAGTTVLPIGNPTNKKAVTQNGISIDDEPSFNTIISNNVISGAIGSGINIFTREDRPASNGHVITGNIIGLNPDGTLGYNVTAPASSFGNQASGIYIRNASNVTIGGSTAATRNVISANGGATHTWPDATCFASWNDYNQIAVYLEWCTNSKVSGNYIGTNAAGTSSGIGTNNIFGNRSGGIKIVGGSTGANNNIIGGTNPGEGNVISGNGYLWGTFTTGSCGSLSGISTGHGIVLQYADCRNTSILGNYIGLTADGVTGLGNNTSGIDVQGASNTTIGGGAAGARNYICNNQFGITLQEDFDVHNAATNTIVAGNYIGLNVNAAAVGNGVSASFTEGAGIVIQKGANTNTIGVSVANGGNVISGNRTGIIIRNAEGAGSNTGPARTNTIQNNIIGLDPTGTTAIPNTSATAGYGYGIVLEVGTGSATTTMPYGNIIGGTGTNEPNTISGNQKSGIYIGNGTAVTAGTANSIIGNNIGTNKAGTAAVANALQGIEILNVSRTTITSNLISGNTQNGISLTGSSTNTIQNNTIGTAADKTAPIPNGANGIFLSASSANTIQGNTIARNTSNGISLAAGSANNIIGGITASLSNTINNNGGNGVIVDGIGSIKNSIHQNSFSCNTARGIVLSNGGNGGYAAPSITGTPTQITWTGGTFIEVYETDGCATCPAGAARLQGKKLVGSGPSPYVFNAAEGFDKTKTYTAIAHEANATTAHNSSEFSQCYTLCQDAATVTVTGAPLTFCEGGSVTLTATVTGGTGTPSYVWNRGGVAISGATASTYTASVSGLYTVTYSSTTTCGPTTSTGVTVTVNNNPVVSNQAAVTICSNSAFTVTPTGAGTGTTYTWTAPSITGGITGGSAQNTDQTSISQTLVNPGTSAGTAVYTVTPKSSAGCSGATFTVTVTVQPVAAVTTANPAAICSGQTTAISLTSSTASATFAWTLGTVTGTVSGQAAGSGASIAQTLINSGTGIATVQYNVVPSAGTCPGTPKTITVTINPVAALTTANPSAICSGQTTAISLTSATPSATYAWTLGTVTGSVSGQAAGSGTSIAQTLTNSGTGIATVEYVVVPSAGTCPGTPKTITATIHPVTVINTTDPAAICSGGTTAISLTSTTPSVTFTWTLGTVTGSVSGQAAGSGANIAQTLVNSGTGVATVQYIVVPSSGVCPGTAKTITATINPVTKLTTADPAAICSGETTAISLTSSTASATFTWTLGAVTNVQGQVAGSGSSISQQLTNNTLNAGSVEYIVVPSFDGCAGTAKTITVTVNPNPTLTTGDPAAICSGETTAISLTSAPASATFVWVLGTVTNVTGAAGGSGSSINQTLANATLTVGTVEYIVKPTLGTCAGSDKKITVTVNPKPVVSNTNPADICSGETTAITLASTPSSATFTWTIGNVTNVSGQSNGSGSSINQTLENSTASAGSVEYIIVPSLTGCLGDAKTIILTVNPKPVVTITPSVPTAICSTDSVDLAANATGFTGGTYTWYKETVNYGIENPLRVKEEGTFHVIYTAATSCSSLPSASITVTFNPDNSEAFAYDTSLTTCLDQLVLAGSKPEYGTPQWTIYSPNPTNASLVAGTSLDSVTVIDLEDGVDYKFLYKVSGACGIDKTDTVFVSVGIDDFDLTASGPTDTLCVKTNRVLTATVIGSGGSGNYNYVWAGSDGSYITTKSPTITINPTQATTTYVVYVEDINKLGCKAQAITPVVVHSVESQNLYIPNLITPNGDNKNDVFYLADRSFYPPMPMISEGSHLEVVNRWGSKVFEADNYKNDWDAKELTDGIYYYHITSSCGNKEYKSWIQILGNTNN